MFLPLFFLHFDLRKREEITEKMTYDRPILNLHHKSYQIQLSNLLYAKCDIKVFLHYAKEYIEIHADCGWIECSIFCNKLTSIDVSRLKGS